MRFDQFDLQVKQTTTVKYSDSGGSGFESRCVSSNGFSIFFLHSYAFLLLNCMIFKHTHLFQNATETFISGFAMRIHFNTN